MDIKKRKLGPSGFLVSSIGLGTMPLSIQGRPSEASAIKVLHAAFESGIDFLDTADVYCLDEHDIGYCERLIAKAIHSWPAKNKIIIATKGGMERPHGAWTTNGQPNHLRQACEASLKALNVDAIDLYQFHAPDPNVPFSESIAELAQLREEGKIKHIGLSNVSVKEIKQARKIVEIVSVQNHCSLHDLIPFEDGVIAYCDKEGLAFLPYSPLGGMSGKLRTANHPVVSKIARNRHANPYQIALAWLLAKSPVIITIPGASKIESVKSSAAAMNLILSEEEIKSIDDRVFMY